MKLRAERATFVEAIGWATRAVAARATMPALSGVLLEAADGMLTCRATDLEVETQIRVPVQIDEPGVALVPGKLLAQLVARFPDSPVELAGDDTSLVLRCGRATFDVRTMNAADFPPAQEPDADAPTGEIRGDALGRMTTQVTRAASSDLARPMLTGVQLESKDGALIAAATDSYRLAVRELQWETALEGSSLVPARALQEVAKSAAEVGGAVSVTLEDGRVSFVLGERRLTTRLIDAQFPDYRRLLPDGFETVVTVDRVELVEALQRVAVVSLGQTNTPVHLQFEDGTVHLQVDSREVGKAAEAVPATIDGDGLEIAFNPTYLLQGLEATGSERIRIELRDGLKPAVLRPEAEEGEKPEAFTYLLMPMRIN